MSVLEAGAKAGVKLTPINGPLGFATWGRGVASGEAVVYVSRDGHAAVVQRATATGLKEDIVLSRSVGDAVRFGWQLELGEGLEARLDADGSVGIYGPQLRFRIPAPVVKVASGMTADSVAHFELAAAIGSKASLELVARGLDGLAYPLTIDPSVVVTTAAELGLGGNLEDGVDLDVAGGRVKRGKTQQGIGAFAATTAFSVARRDHTSVAYNGFLYVIGGTGGSALNDVQVAPINANGTVGAFVVTASFATARREHSSFAYNGFLYVVGGATGSGHLADVQVAPINANGTLGAFVATTALPSARAGHTSVTWAGHLYVTGGTNGSALAEVLVAPINANGTLGAFVASTPLPSARSAHASVAYKGFLYVLGGLSPGLLNDVQVAPINADGTVGTFAATTGLPTARSGHATVASNGSLYVIGGNGGADLSEVRVAAIHANGMLGAFSSTTALPAARSDHSSVAYNGMLYVLGGGSFLNDVQVAPINGNGRLGGFFGAGGFANVRTDHSTVTYNNFIYVIGGYGQSVVYADVQMAPINANGTVGTFATTTALPGFRASHTSVAFNGYLYVIGGAYGSGRYNDVLVAKINNDGTLGAFTATSSFTTGRERHTSVVYNGFLYVIGGATTGTVMQSDVQVAPILSNGNLGAFVATTSLPSARYRHASVAYNGFLYVSGGDDASFNTLADTLVAPINANGTLGTFVASTPLPYPRTYHAIVAHNGYLYVSGGFYGTYQRDVSVAPINANGTVGAFESTSLFTNTRYGHTSVAANGHLYILGGYGPLYRNDVQAAPIYSHGPLGTFTPTTSLPTTMSDHTTVAYNGWLYLVGGGTDVQMAPLTREGTMGAFTTTSAITTSRSSHTSVAYRGFLYVIGGRASFTNRTDVQVAAINTDGTLGTFAQTTPLPLGRSEHTTVIHNGFLYVVGGSSSAGSRSDVVVAPINADGTLGAFTTTNSFVGARGYHSSVAYNGYVYVLGGGGGGGFSDVQVAQTNADGTLGAFTATSSMPGGRWGHTSEAANGYLYVIGGYDLNGPTAGVWVAPINSNGSLGAFSSTRSLPGARYYHSSATDNSHLYVFGGYGSSQLSEVQVAPLNTPTAEGNYSRLVDFGAPSAPTSITINASATNGLVGLAYRAASASGVFGPLIVKGNLPRGVAVPLAGDNIRYLWIRFTLDDTNVATINPDVSGERDVQNFTVAYALDPVLTPGSVTLPPRGAQAFGCSGGSGTGYLFAVNPNNSGATINASTGSYVAGNAGSVTDTVTCTDSAGNKGFAQVTVTAIVGITVAGPSLTPRGTQTLIATGGSGAGFVWTFVTNNSTATLSAAGAYQAGTTGNVVDTVRVTDSLGNAATAAINVTAGVSVSPASSTIVPKQALAFSAIGGSDAGFIWTFQTNASGGTIGPVTGAYVAGPTGGVSDIVLATDSLGNTATGLVTLGPAVSISPPALSLAPRDTAAFSATGGTNTGFAWSFVTNASTGTLNASTGAYRAGNTGSVTDVVQVTDSLGNVTQRDITVTAGISISPNPAAAAPSTPLLLVASGGSGTGYVWTFATNRSGGTLLPLNGYYTAGVTAGVVDDIRVMDSLGNVGTVMVMVGGQLALSPLLPLVAPRQQLTFVAMGGAGGNRWSLTSNNSGGSIEPLTGVYVAGASGSTLDTVRVTDQTGNVAQTQVSVAASVSIAPTAAVLPPRGTQSFAAQGGADGGYTFSVSANNSGATIDPVTGAYHAGITGDVKDTISVQDTLGNSTTASVTVTSAIIVSPSKANVNVNESQTFTAAGGSGDGFVWAMAANPSAGSVDATTGGYTAGPTGNVSDDVQVTDSLGNTATARITVIPDSVVDPTVRRTKGQYGGWGCGCGASSGEPFGLVLLLLLMGRRRFAPLALVVVLMAPLIAQAEGGKLKLLASEATGPKGSDQTELAALTAALETEISGIGFYQVLTSKDVAALLGIERQKQILGCAENSQDCLIELSDALDTDRLLRAEVSLVDNFAVLTVTLTAGKSMNALGRASRRASDVAGLTLEMRGAVYETVNQDPARAKEKVLVAERRFGGFMLAVRGDFDAVGGGGAPAVMLQYSGRRFGVALTGVIKPSPGARLEARWFPITLGRVRPIVLAGGVASGTGIGIRAGAGFEVHYGHFNAFLDAAYERYFQTPPEYLLDAATIGAGVGWTF